MHDRPPIIIYDTITQPKLYPLPPIASNLNPINYQKPLNLATFLTIPQIKTPFISPYIVIFKV